MITFDGMLNEQMNDEEFRKEYEAIIVNEFNI